MIAVRGSAPVGAESTKKNPVVENATQKVLQGEQIFRFDTFGDQAFWGDTLKLHQAIEGAKFGGVGPGVSPKTALIPKSEIGGFTNHPWMQKLRSGAEGHERVSDTSARVTRETTCPDQIVWVKLLTRTIAQTCETKRPQAGNALAQLAHPAPNSRHVLAALRSNAQRGASPDGSCQNVNHPRNLHDLGSASAAKGSRQIWRTSTVSIDR